MGNTYGDVRTKFMARMNRRDMDTTLADGFLQDAITRIQRNMRLPAMEKAVIINIDSSYTTNGGIFIPADYLQLRRIMYNEEYAVRREDESVVVPLARYATGMPEVFCRRGGLWVLAPMPEGPVTLPDLSLSYNKVRIDYYAEFPAMINTSDESVLSDIASDLMLYGALSYACDHFSDKRGDKFEARYMQIASDIQGMADDDELAGGAAVQPSFFYADDLQGTW